MSDDPRSGQRPAPVELSALLASYARTVGVIDNAIHGRFSELGEQTTEVLQRSLLDRLRDGDRFRLLRAILQDLEAAGPVDAIDQVLRAAKPLRDAIAHAAHASVQDGPGGVEWVMLIPAAVASSRDIWAEPVAAFDGHRRRVEWAEDWVRFLFWPKAERARQPPTAPPPLLL